MDGYGFKVISDVMNIHLEEGGDMSIFVVGPNEGE
jgi:hypothetical protein